MKKEGNDEAVLEKGGGVRATRRSSRTSAIIAHDTMKAANFQKKGRLKECKNKKDESAEKPDIDRKPIVRCDKLIVYDGKKQDEKIKKDDEIKKDD